LNIKKTIRITITGPTKVVSRNTPLTSIVCDKRLRNSASANNRRVYENSGRGWRALVLYCHPGPSQGHFWVDRAWSACPNLTRASFALNSPTWELGWQNLAFLCCILRERQRPLIVCETRAQPTCFAFPGYLYFVLTDACCPSLFSFPSYYQYLFIAISKWVLSPSAPFTTELLQTTKQMQKHSRPRICGQTLPSQAAR
jgi:hypothetical protein